MLYRIVAAKALPDYRLWIRFHDGIEGEVDLSHLVGKGVFRRWEAAREFARVRVDPETETVVWPGDLHLAPDALYRDIAGASAE
jgi:hypothetical protein